MEQSRYVFTPKISLKPDRVTAYNEVSIRNTINGTLDSITKKRAKIYNPDTFEEIKLEKKFHNFKISSTGQKTIQNKINWLYVMAKSRYQKTYSGKEIFNFKVNFLTLTLPSKQVHNTAEITNTCFNQFLTELRQRTKMENYLWRLEFQGNGNLHYHIVTDSYIDYFLAQKIWNRIINKLGYVDVFTDKFKNMSLLDYEKATNSAKKVTFDIIAKRYAKGKLEKWTNPPSIDVKVCTSNKAIAHYISKYFGKKSDINPIHNELDNEENSFGLRLWFCSRSLSKLNSVVDYAECCEINFFDFIKESGKAIEMIFEYAKCLFFNLSDFSNYYKSVIIPVLKDYAKTQGYVPAV